MTFGMTFWSLISEVHNTSTAGYWTLSKLRITTIFTLQKLQQSILPSIRIKPSASNDNSTETFDKFIISIQSYLRHMKLDESDEMDLFLLSLGVTGG